MNARRTRRALFALALAIPLLAAGLAAAVLLRGNDETETAYRGSLPPPGILLPEFTLPDHRGTIVSSTDLNGKALLVTFLDTQCTEACPVIASLIGQALDRLRPAELRQVEAIAISTDPDEDTPASVGTFLRTHRVEGRLRYLVAPVDRLRLVWNAFHIAASFDTGDDSLHSAPVRIYDRGGTWVSTQHTGSDLTPDNLVHDIRLVLGGGG
jgi:protein SCO1/2